MQSQYLNDADLTFLVCGVCDETFVSQVISPIKLHYPNSKIIVSTWIGSTFLPIAGVQFVLSGDPGSVLRNEKKKIFMNLNRQIITLKAGLQHVNTNYVIKIRTDMTVENSKLLRFRFKDATGVFRKFGEQIAILDFTSVNKTDGMRIPFHFCDWVLFGRTSVVQKLLTNLSLVDERSFCKYYNGRYSESAKARGSLEQYTAEIYLHKCIFQSVYKLQEFSTFNYDKTVMKKSHIYQRNFLTICSLRELGLTSLKYKRTAFNMRHSITRYDTALLSKNPDIDDLFFGIIKKVKNILLFYIRWVYKFRKITNDRYK